MSTVPRQSKTTCAVNNMHFVDSCFIVVWSVPRCACRGMLTRKHAFDMCHAPGHTHTHHRWYDCCHGNQLSGGGYSRTMIIIVQPFVLVLGSKINSAGKVSRINCVLLTIIVSCSASYSTPGHRDGMQLVCVCVCVYTSPIMHD